MQPKIQVFNESGLSACPELRLWVPCSVEKAKSPSLASSRMVDPSKAKSTASKAVLRVESEPRSVAWPAGGRIGRTRLCLRQLVRSSRPSGLADVARQRVESRRHDTSCSGPSVSSHSRWVSGARMSCTWFTVATFVTLGLLGFVVGAPGTLVGAGGGFILTPVLLILYRPIRLQLLLQSVWSPSSGMLCRVLLRTRCNEGSTTSPAWYSLRSASSRSVFRRSGALGIDLLVDTESDVFYRRFIRRSLPGFRLYPADVPADNKRETPRTL